MRLQSKVLLAFALSAGAYGSFLHVVLQGELNRDLARLEQSSDRAQVGDSAASSAARVPLQDLQGGARSERVAAARERVVGAAYGASAAGAAIAFAALYFFAKKCAVVPSAATGASAASESLAHERDALRAQLAASRADLAAAQDRAELAEVATNVLHDVGNLLNGVNVTSESLARRLGESSLVGVEALAGLVSAQRADFARWVAEDPRGQSLPDLMDQVAGVVRMERESLSADSTELRELVQAIAFLVRSQQTFAGGPDHAEPCDLDDLVSLAIGLAELHGERGGVNVVRCLETPRLVSLQKHRVLQVLVNLLANARDAVRESEHGTSIEIRTRLVEGRLRIEVTDDGVGIPSENAVAIFRHGFTTKKDGHGFGLHSAAGVAGELGGSLSAISEGRGKGSTFVLEIPIENAEAQLV